LSELTSSGCHCPISLPPNNEGEGAAEPAFSLPRRLLSREEDFRRGGFPRQILCDLKEEGIEAYRRYKSLYVTRLPFPAKGGKESEMSSEWREERQEKS